LFFRALPTKSLAVKREKCTGGKISKERLSVIVREYSAINGKAAKPRCFKNLKINNLPVSGRKNKKSLDGCSYNGRVVKHV
jgi:hypothetical protein